ncbi:pentatricopeptide repeat-containing protein At1g06143 [Carica papaya]|uniref:pentatricopeptide repeat-containing protein At1g06143 n=1 Tax=Carica papaya TaxID=3649 RepID=UPI000B8CE5EF|nr:pentatricopeptide repeat-containing protein At1g06143 [Carica papaya]
MKPITRVNRSSIRNHLYHTISLDQNQTIVVDRIKKCVSFRILETIYAAMTKTSADQDCFLVNQFISACTAFSRVDCSVLAFTQVFQPNVFVYNALIRGFIHCHYPNQSLEYYKHMLKASICPTSFTFSSLVKASASAISACGFGESVHAHVWKHGFDSHVHVQTALLDFYSCTGKMVESRKVFDEMPVRDPFAWTAMISAHLRDGNLSSAINLFDEMPEKLIATWNTMIDGYARLGNLESAEELFNQTPVKDAISWTTMIACYSQKKKFREALSVFNEMMVNGISPDEVTMSTVISACAHLGALDLGKKIHLYVMQNGFELDVYIGSALVDMYAKCGSLDKSLLVFFKLSRRNLFCWNSIIEGLAAHGYARKALAMFSRMQKEIEPNGVTFVSILTACTHAGLVEEGRKRFQSMIDDYSIIPGVEHYGCMVDLLSKAGLLEEGLELIRQMEFEPNSVIWGALLGGCKLHKNLEIAKVAIDELMVLEPNNSGYYTLLVNMYAEVNRWGEVAKTRARMKQSGVEKRCPGSSLIEMESKIHQFAASDKSHPASDEVYLMLAELDGQMKLPESVY